MRAHVLETFWERSSRKEGGTIVGSGSVGGSTVVCGVVALSVVRREATVTVGCSVVGVVVRADEVEAIDVVCTVVEIGLLVIVVVVVIGVVARVVIVEDRAVVVDVEGKKATVVVVIVEVA